MGLHHRLVSAIPYHGLVKAEVWLALRVKTEVVDVVQRLRILLEVDELIPQRSKKSGIKR
jgi:hypothetical protein|tara:strand:+ start:104 stop:283 length:180 start_codon:yes stop_codon:yes gene_type:complete